MKSNPNQHTNMKMDTHREPGATGDNRRPTLWHAKSPSPPKNAFGEFLSSEPIRVVSGRVDSTATERVFLSTYPAIHKVFQSFDVGFFDLIIADESHRSIYNVYGDIFHYFDSLSSPIIHKITFDYDKALQRTIRCSFDHPPITSRLRVLVLPAICWCALPK